MDQNHILYNGWITTTTTTKNIKHNKTTTRRCKESQKEKHVTHTHTHTQHTSSDFLLSLAVIWGSKPRVCMCKSHVLCCCFFHYSLVLLFLLFLLLLCIFLLYTILCKYIYVRVSVSVSMWVYCVFFVYMTLLPACKIYFALYWAISSI